MGTWGLCADCQKDIPRVHGEVRGNETERRIFGRVDFVRAGSFAYYRKGEDFAHLISNAKYYKYGWINSYFATLFADELTPVGWPFDIDTIIPVPLHPLRLISRRYNQSLPIAEAFANLWHLPLDSIEMTKFSTFRSQVGRTGDERIRAMAGSFRLRHPETFAGRHVLVVDDILTTGATVAACAQILADAGARTSVLTLGLSR